VGIGLRGIVQKRKNLLGLGLGKAHRVRAGDDPGMGGVPEAVGGVANHVHLLIGLRSTHCLADSVRDLKAVSSRWVHEEVGFASFSWQEGYGAFTVSASQRKQVSDYIARQEEHHRHRTFQEEYVEFLERSGVDYNKRFLW
jgi:hypothetical protein